MTFDLGEHVHRRYNPLIQQWVLVSPHRAKRPWQGQVEKCAPDLRPEYDPKCYLCPGNMRVNGEVNPHYGSIHAFTNDFSALVEHQPEGSMDESFFYAQAVRGICRVVMFSPKHNLTLSQMSPDSIASIVSFWKDEYENLSCKDFINYVQIFENKGAVMGCSNPHPHGQIWATQSIPQEILIKTHTQSEYFKSHKSNMLIDYLEQELIKKERLIFENDEFVVLVPFWAVWPFEAMIIPRNHVSSLKYFSKKQIKALGQAINVLTIKYDNLFQTSFPYSAGLHQAPSDDGDYESFTWHMVFYPPLLRSATVKKFMVGYELLAEPQRDITAETSAARLRNQLNIHFLNK